MIVSKAQKESILKQVTWRCFEIVKMWRYIISEYYYRYSILYIYIYTHISENRWLAPDSPGHVRDLQRCDKPCAMDSAAKSNGVVSDARSLASSASQSQALWRRTSQRDLFESFLVQQQSHMFELFTKC